MPPHCVGWVRHGTDEHPGDIAVVMSNMDDGCKRMQIDVANGRYRDITDHVAGEITTDAAGSGDFSCVAGLVSVWVPA